MRIGSICKPTLESQMDGMAETDLGEKISCAGALMRIPFEAEAARYLLSGPVTLRQPGAWQLISLIDKDKIESCLF